MYRGVFVTQASLTAVASRASSQSQICAPQCLPLRGVVRTGKHAPKLDQTRPHCRDSQSRYARLTAGHTGVLSSSLELVRCWLPQVRTSRYAGLDTLCPSGPVMPFSKVSFCRYAAGMHDQPVRLQSEVAVPLCLAG